MKPSEFRLGNLVNAIFEDENGKQSSTICRITAIDEYGNLGDGYEFMFESVDGESHEVYEESNPIKLTEDWLLKFGLKLSSTAKWRSGYNDVARTDKVYVVDNIYEACLKIVVIYDIDEKELRRIGIDNSVGVMACNIEFVHQLQNICFALTGEELELK